MKKASYIKFMLVFFLFESCFFGHAQKIKFNFPTFKSQLHPKEIFFSSGDRHFIQSNFSFSKEFNSKIRPMFCKMEDNLHKRFNVWIVFRAGTDDGYRRLIADKM